MKTLGGFLGERDRKAALEAARLVGLDHVALGRLVESLVDRREKLLRAFEIFARDKFAEVVNRSLVAALLVLVLLGARLGLAQGFFGRFGVWHSREIMPDEIGKVNFQRCVYPIFHYTEPMIYSVSGRLAAKEENFAVVEAGGVGYKIFTNKISSAGLPGLGEQVFFFCRLVAPEGSLDLYGFPNREQLALFEQLISVSGVGPKSALSILDVAVLSSLKAAIVEGRADLLSKASGIGQKTAQRIILELKSKVQAPASEATVARMQSDSDVVETLVALGYRRDHARSALSQITEEATELEDRLKAALKILGGKK